MQMMLYYNRACLTRLFFDIIVTTISLNILLSVCMLLVPSASCLSLTCSPEHCSDRLCGVISCNCTQALASLNWIIRSQSDGSVLCRSEVYHLVSSPEVGVFSNPCNGYYVVLNDIDTSEQFPTFSSSLLINSSLFESVELEVNCQDTLETTTVNLADNGLVLISTSHDVETSTEDQAFSLVHHTTSTGLSTTISSLAPPADFLLRLDITAVAGVVVADLAAMVLVYTCGILTGILVQRQRLRGTSKDPPTSTPASPGKPDAAAGQLVPMYEELLPPATSVPLQENVSYRQLPTEQTF